MAQIDIGKIKPVFRGTYDGSTAYVLDDIVYYSGSSYVAKTSTTGNLPTDTTKWNVLASGSGGIWSSSLSIGSAGQVVKVNSGATALEFGTIVSKLLQAQVYEYTSRNSVSQSTSDQAITTWTTGFVKQSATSNLYIWNENPTHGSNQGTQQVMQKFTHTDGTVSEIFGSKRYQYSANNNATIIGMQGVATGMKVGTYTIVLMGTSLGANGNGGMVFNPTTSDDNRNEYSTDTQGATGQNGSKSTLIIQEIEV